MQHLPHVLPVLVTCAPGTESVLTQELRDLGVVPGAPPAELAGGVECEVTLPQLLLLNRASSTAVRVLVRLGSFKAVHLSELTRRAKELPWGSVLRPGEAVRVRATCHKSRIYHSGAAAQRVGEACGGIMVQGEEHAAATQIFVRLVHDRCTVSVDASGEPLYHRGTKHQQAKAPLRESLAAALLRLAGWHPGLPLIDPMCGSGTLPLEAATRAAGLAPGRARSFACEAWPMARGVTAAPCRLPVTPTTIWAYDRNGGAVEATKGNAARAGLEPYLIVGQQSLTQLQRPAGPPGWIIVNPPYGQRIGDVRQLVNLYAALGNLVRGPLEGWKLGLITATPRLAHATGLQFARVSPPLPHGGLKVRLYCSV